MKLFISFLAITATLVLASGHTDNNVEAANAQTSPNMSFFVGPKNKTGNLEGLRGADSMCQKIAASVGLGNKTWRAYLSAEQDPDNNNSPVDARNRIGNGPWVNANGVTVAKDLAELHSRKGDPDVFVDERGQRIPGNWPGSPKPTEHDILTGSTADGRLIAGKTCNSWTSESPDLQAQVGHSDMGGSGFVSPTSGSWNSSHENGSCADTGPRGGAGRIYCFAR